MGCEEVPGGKANLKDRTVEARKRKRDIKKTQKMHTKPTTATGGKWPPTEHFNKATRGWAEQKRKPEEKPIRNAISTAGKKKNMGQKLQKYNPKK